MNKANENLIQDLANQLGGDKVIPLRNSKSKGPLELLQLREDLERLTSSGGRPTSPEWEIKRLVPFTEDNWEKLKELTKKLQKEGYSGSPSQLAALLIERGLSNMV